VNEHNLREARTVVLALDAFHAEQGRYPPSLAALRPAFLARDPALRQPAALYYDAGAGRYRLAIVYWLEPGFLPSDRCFEYDSATRIWTNIDYSDLGAKQPGGTASMQGSGKGAGS
jgi:hypothetical protein